MKKFRSTSNANAFARRFGGPPSVIASALFPGSTVSTSGALTVAANSVFTLGTQNHTIEFWMYQTSRGAYDCPFSYDITTSPQTTSNYYFNVGSSQFMLILGSGGGWAFTMNCGTAPSLNTWHHYAIVRNGNTFTVYVDGTSVGSTVVANSIAVQTGAMGIGSAGPTTAFGISGYMTNFRFVKGTAVYTSNFTPPTTHLTAIAGTQLLLQGLVDNGPNTFAVTNTNGVVSSTQTPLAS